MQYAKQRLFLTAERDRLVAEGDPDGATLYAAPGDEIPASACEKFGLIDGDLADHKPKAKAKKGGENKENAPGENKDPVPPAPPADPAAPAAPAAPADAAAAAAGAE